MSANDARRYTNDVRGGRNPRMVLVGTNSARLCTPGRPAPSLPEIGRRIRNPNQSVVSKPVRLVPAIACIAHMFGRLSWRQILRAVVLSQAERLGETQT